MADYRQIHTRIWKDSWFLRLDSKAKLLFIYLFSNERASVSGIYELPIQVMCFESGLDEETVTRNLEKFVDAGKVHYEDGLLWVVNLRKYNASNSPKVRQRIRKDFESLRPGPIKQAYAQRYDLEYPIRVSDKCQIPYQDIVLEQEQEQEQEQEIEHNKITPHPPEGVDLLVDSVFDKWNEYFPEKPKPRRTDAQMKKVERRLKNPDFRKRFSEALLKASLCNALNEASWFRFDFFVRNDENYIKMLDGWMDWKDQEGQLTSNKDSLKVGVNLPDVSVNSEGIY